MRSHRLALVAAACTTAALVSAAPTQAQTLTAGAPADTFAFTTHASGLGQLTDFRFLPDGRVVLVSKTGEVRLRKVDGTLTLAAKLPVDTASEKGLLGVEVDPAFVTNARLYFYYSLASASGGTDLDRHRVVAMTLLPDGTLDLTSEKILVRGLRGPANHDGGALALSKDGTKLFVGVGDTGCNSGKAAEPPYTPTNYFGTCLTNGNGKVLRVNLDGSIPTDNPLVGVSAVTACGTTCGASIATTGTAAPRTDIWAWGFRNPFRLWTDPVTGNVWVGDVGEVTYEEIGVVQKGRHHGWPWREGRHGWPLAKCNDVTPKGDCVDPVHEQVHSTSVKSITGGAIVDHCTWPAPFRGAYFFGDNATNQLWTVQPTTARDGVVAGSQKDFGSVASPVSIRPGPDGALYVASLGGKLIRFAPKAPLSCDADAGVGDAGSPDGGGSDVGATDASVIDSGAADAGAADASVIDAGAADASVIDAGAADAGAADGGTADTSLADAGLADGGASDGATTEPDAAADTPAATDESGGCGCAIPRRTEGSTTAGLALALGALGLARRASRAKRNGRPSVTRT